MVGEGGGGGGGGGAEIKYPWALDRARACSDVMSANSLYLSIFSFYYVL